MPGELGLLSWGTAAWILLEIKGRTSTFQVRCETVAHSVPLYQEAERYSAGKNSVWEASIWVRVLNEMEALAWASR